MAERCECSREGEFIHLNQTINEIKATAKEDAKARSQEMLGLLESKIRTELALEGIKKEQSDSNKYQAEMMQGIKEIKDEPFIKWKKLNWLWKVAAGIAVINWLVGNGLGYLKMLKIIN